MMIGSICCILLGLRSVIVRKSSKSELKELLNCDGTFVTIEPFVSYYIHTSLTAGSLKLVSHTTKSIEGIEYAKISFYFAQQNCSICPTN